LESISFQTMLLLFIYVIVYVDACLICEAPDRERLRPALFVISSSRFSFSLRLSYSKRIRSIRKQLNKKSISSNQEPTEEKEMCKEKEENSSQWKERSSVRVKEPQRNSTNKHNVRYKRKKIYVIIRGDNGS
jgi:hypothetical protein